MPEPTLPISQQDSSSEQLPTRDNTSSGFLQNTALRYAAGDLNEEEAAAFETLLANDQNARDALSESVRLSAAAIGQAPPAPHPSFRSAIRERLLGWCPGWLAPRAYRGHPLLWAGLGAVTIGTCTVFGLSLIETEPVPRVQPASIPSPLPDGHGPSSEIAETAIAPEPRSEVSETMIGTTLTREHVVGSTTSAACNAEPTANPTVAEIWASLSTPDHVEKAHDDELKWRHKLREMGAIHPGRPSPASSFNDLREP